MPPDLRNLAIAGFSPDKEDGRVLSVPCRSPRFLPALVVSTLALVATGSAQEAGPNGAAPAPAVEAPHAVIPPEVSEARFSALRASSPFSRTLNLPRSLVLTGIAEIGSDTVATIVDLETRESFVVSQQEVSANGWQLVDVSGDQTRVESLTAKVRLAGGSEIISVRYEKTPNFRGGVPGVRVSNRIGDGSAGGGTGPHGGPDPRVLTPDQLADARKAAREIRRGFQADGYADNQRIPDQVVSKLEKLSVSQREALNVKMFEYRNRGLGMKERVQIYNRLLDRAVRSR